MTLTSNDYVLATKYNDGDPGDQWAVGFFHSMLPKVTEDRFMVVDSDGNQFRGNGFRRCQKITGEQGAYILANQRSIEATACKRFYDEEGNQIGKSLWDWLEEAP